MVGVIEVRESGSRAVTRAEGRETLHSFSFGAHYDPRNVGFASLVALNDERLPVGTGYPDHPHADTEIVSWVVEGALRHTSTVGSGVLGAGSAQVLSAGSGVVHSEVADGPPTRFVQAWVRPDSPGTPPSWTSAADVAGVGSGWTCLAGAGGLLPLAAAGASLHLADLRDGDRLALPDAPRLHLLVLGSSATGPTEGLMLGERRLLDGDAARLLDEGSRPITGVGPCQVLVWAFAG